MNSEKFQKVRQLYGDISIENTLKLLIRCKILFGSRYALLDLFQRVFIYENDLESKAPYLKTLESAEKVVIKAEQIKGSQKFKNLKGKPIYFMGEDLVSKIY